MYRTHLVCWCVVVLSYRVNSVQETAKRHTRQTSLLHYTPSISIGCSDVKVINKQLNVSTREGEKKNHEMGLKKQTNFELITDRYPGLF